MVHTQTDTQETEIEDVLGEGSQVAEKSNCEQIEKIIEEIIDSRRKKSGDSKRVTKENQYDLVLVVLNLSLIHI